MKTVTTTITSKNQITIPALIVRNLNLKHSRQLRVRLRGDDIVLTPLPTLRDNLLSVWDQAAKTIKQPQTDEDIKRSLRSIASRQALDGATKN